MHGDDPSRIALNTPKRAIALVPGKTSEQFISLEDAKPLPQIDVIFPIVHGNLGEDVVTRFIAHGRYHCRSGVLGSSACMDKDVTKRLLRDAGLNIAPFITVLKNERATTEYEATVAQWVYHFLLNQQIKVHLSGSVKSALNQNFTQHWTLLFLFDMKVLIESAVKGREIECAVLGNNLASPCGEIVLHDSFYAYHTKYIDENGASVVAPAQLDAAVSDKIREIALSAYRALNCSGMSRVDVFNGKQRRGHQ